MLDNKEIEFLKSYKKELIDPIDILITNYEDVAATKLILLGIDSLSGFFTGRTKSGLVSSSFISFVEVFLPNFDRISFPTSGVTLQNRRSGKHITKPSEILYHILRNDLIHDSAVGFGVEIYRDTDNRVLWSGEGTQIFRINIIGFFEYFKVAINDYEAKLMSDSDLQKNFKLKFEDVTNLVFGL